MNNHATRHAFGLGAGTMLYALLVNPANVTAQNSTIPILKEFRQRVWTTEDGLPDNSVRSVFQTRDGYLWVGMVSGLARFDGSKFLFFNHQNSPIPPNQGRLAMAEDPDGYLWIATHESLLRYKEGSFSRYTTQEGLWSDDVTSVRMGKSGRLWIGTREGLNFFEHERLMRVPEHDWTNAASQVVYDLYEDDTNRLWIASEFMVHTRNTSNWAPEAVLLNGRPFGGSSLHKDSKGTMWVGGIMQLFESKEGGWISHPIREEKALGIVTSIVTDPAGSLWFSLSNTGLGRYRNGLFSFHDRRDGLPEDSITRIAQDREGNLWLGTFESGLVCWQPRRCMSFSMQDGLATNEVRAVFGRSNGDFWIGTDAGVAHLVRSADWLIQTNYTTAQGLPINTVRSLWEDRQGRLWVGTELGLNCLVNGRFTLIPVPGEIYECAVRVIYEDRAGAIWFGSKWGLHRWVDGARTTYTQADGLSASEPRAILESNNGDLWVGTLGGGLNCLSFPPRESKTPSKADQTFPPPPIRMSGFGKASPSQDEAAPRVTVYNTSHGLSSDFVIALHEELDGTLWIGTRAGLNRLRDGRVSSLTTTNGLPDQWINSILDDGTGDLWMSSDQGVFHARKEDLHRCADGLTNRVACVVYTESEGLPSLRTNGGKSQPAGVKCRDGTLWFATPKGVAIIDPVKAKASEVSPTIIIEQVRANGEIVYGNAVSVGKGQSQAPFDDRREQSQPRPIQSKVSRGRAAIRLAPGTGNVLEFHYTAPNFVAPGASRFRYRLHGFKNEWVEAGNRQIAYYTNLRPGNYRFEAMASDHRGLWSENDVRLSFYLAPRVYETWWFRAAALIAAVTGSWGFLRWRRKMMWLEHQRELAQERARITRDLHDDLGAGVTHATRLLEQARQKSVLGENVEALFASIERQLRAISQTVGQAVWSGRPERDTLEDLALYICQYGEEFFQAAQIRWRLDLPEPFPRKSITAEARHNLFLAVKEALNNIVKHAEATEARFFVSVAANEFILAVEDNGRGFTVSQPAKPGSRQRSGNGLSNMRHRVESIGGQFELRSQPGGGTRIELRMPV